MFEGVPETIIVLLEKEAVTPSGRPLVDPIPVAPFVENVITGEIGESTHRLGLADAALTKLS
jgi:hypothetical protein